MKNNHWLSRALKKRSSVFALKGFTLVELMVVLAVISVLAALAVPAYTNYATKAKFTEVTLATAPTKTAIATCATSGECISGNAINLSGNMVSGAAVVVATGSSTPTPSNGYTPPGTTWVQCGGENGTCVFAGTYVVLYGTQTSNVEATMGNGATCGNGVFGDPAYGVVKTCWVAIPTALVNGLPATGTVGGGLNGMFSIPCVAASGAYGCSPSTKYAASVSYDTSGVITATATNTSGLKAETFILRPSYSSGRVDWSVSGSCKTRGGGALC